MSFTNSQYWAPRSHTSTRTAPHNMNHNTNYIELNPLVHDFYPTDELRQHHDQTSLMMPSSVPASTIGSLQTHHVMLESHLNHDNHLARLERSTRRNTSEIAATQRIVRDDMQSLQAQIEDLKQQLATSPRRAAPNEQDLSPPRIFTERYSKQAIVEAYIAEAEDCERTAAGLRVQAKDICSNVTNPQKRIACESFNGLNGTHDNVQSEIVPDGKVRCDTPMRELFMEDDRSHGRLPSGGDANTPTHVPPPRPLRLRREKADTHTLEVEPFVQTALPAETRDGGIQTDERIALPAGIRSWTPLAVRRMPPTQPQASNNTGVFTYDFLKANLGGEEWSPGFYFNSNSKREINIKSYWLLDAEFEPFLPFEPGTHGAKLTAFFNGTVGEHGKGPSEDDYDYVPVFIRTEGREEYTYFGHYSQSRFSDKLDYDHLIENVPNAVLRHHAEELANPARPQWLTEELMNHFWPMPRYSGPTPTDSAINTPNTEATAQTGTSVVLEKQVQRSLERYAEELKAWNKEATLKLSLITGENIMDAFNKADEDEEPGLRLYLEYFQFVHYDQDLYNFLVKVQAEPLRFPPRVAGNEKTPQKIPPKYTTRISGKCRIPTEQSEREWVEDKKSTSTAKKTVPNNKPGPKKRQLSAGQTDKQPVTFTKGTDVAKPRGGDLETAKKLQDEFKNGGKGKHAGTPHLRAKKAA